MKSIIAAGILAFGLLSVEGGHANATAITVGSGWQPFLFRDIGSSWDQDFTFTLTKAATLKVTDVFSSGDQFVIEDGGLPLGMTSVPGSIGAYTADYDVAFASTDFSHAAFNFGPGSYDISGRVLQSPYGGGGAAVELVSTVPLPASAPMFGAALLALAGFSYGMSRWVAPKAGTAAAA